MIALFENRISKTNNISVLEEELEILFKIFDNSTNDREVQIEMVNKMNIIYDRLSTLRRLSEE